VTEFWSGRTGVVFRFKEETRGLFSEAFIQAVIPKQHPVKCVRFFFGGGGARGAGEDFFPPAGS